MIKIFWVCARDCALCRILTSTSGPSSSAFNGGYEENVSAHLCQVISSYLNRPPFLCAWLWLIWLERGGDRWLWWLEGGRGGGGTVGL